MIKMNRNQNLLNKFNKLIEVIPNKFTKEEFENIFFKLFKKENWKKDVNNIITMLYYIGYIKVYKNINGTIKNCEVYNRKKVDNFNDLITGFFS